MDSIAIDPVELAIRSGVLNPYAEHWVHGGLDGLGFTFDSGGGGASGDDGSGFLVGGALPGDSVDAVIQGVGATVSDVLNTMDQVSRSGQNIDQIVPVQLRIQNSVLAPIAAAIQSPNAAQITVSQWQTMLNQLQATQNAWLNFLHNPPNAGQPRAAGGEKTLAPYWPSLIGQIQALMQNAPSGATGNIVTVPIVTSPGIPGGGALPVTGSPGGFSIAGLSATELIVGGLVLLLVVGRRGRG